MILLPVIERELRASARQPFTHHLRLLGVMALLVVVALFALQGNLGSNSGGMLFAALHCTLFFAIWLLVPLLTADCVSRERREGTLPLLFLTPLKARDIIWAKGAAQGLRAFTLWLAVVPVLTICFVAGGLGWPEVVFSVFVNFSSICLAITAGLLASARTKSWTRALALAMCLAGALLLVFGWLVVFVLLALAAPSGRASWFFAPAQTDSGATPFIGIALAINFAGVWQDWLGSLRAGPWPLVKGFGTVALYSLLCLVLLIRFAAWNVKRTWQETPPSARVSWMKQKFFKPVLFQKTLRRWLSWQLQRNPIGWLEQRSWSGRLVVWSWLAVVVCIYSSLFTNLSMYQHGFHGLQTILAALLAGSIAVSAAGSFRRERETGVMELLLVAPLREWHIILGRVRGLWSQFLPSIILLCAVWLYCATFLTSDREWPSVLLSLVTFATVPIVGLYFSLTCANFITALLCTVGLQMIVPAILGQVVAFLQDSNSSANSSGIADQSLVLWLVPPGFQVFVAFLLAERLHDNLKGRKFAVQGKGP